MPPIVKICLTPALYPIYKADNEIVVVVDLFRATTAICVALHHGAESVIPVSGLKEFEKYKGKNYLFAAERGGKIVDGYKYGNSPLMYKDNLEIRGKKLVLSSTNGTQAINAAKGHGTICIAAFSNLTAIAQWLTKQQNNVMILCSGWKKRFNLEDTLFAGALSQVLLNNGFGLEKDKDAPLMAIFLYEKAKVNIQQFLKDSSHRTRLTKLNLQADIDYCLQLNVAPVVPVLGTDEIVNIS